MARHKKKQEDVTISFHFLERRIKDPSGDFETKPFTEAEFDGLYQKLKKLEKLDLNDSLTKESVRYRTLVPTESCEQFDGAFISGIYEGAYSGHEYKNTVKGKIPADSISLRKFFFLLYLSDDGRIYIGSQYLGNFGGYMAIKNTVIGSLPDSHNIFSNTFRVNNTYFSDYIAKEVEVTVATTPKDIVHRTQLSTTVALSYKKSAKDDDFSKKVNDNILSKSSGSAIEIKKAIASAVSNDVIQIRDEDIEDCKVFAYKGKNKKVIHLFDGSNFATRFHMDIKLEANGHPKYNEVKDKSLEILREQIIGKLNA